MANHVEVRPPVGARPNGSWARYVTSAIATWLLLSAFLWTHGDAQRVNTWVVGMLMLIVSLAAAVVPKMRYVNTILAMWLFFSTIVLRGYAPTVANNLIVAAVIFGLSLAPPGRRPGATPPARRSPMG
jgi:hypothetical protein